MADTTLTDDYSVYGNEVLFVNGSSFVDVNDSLVNFSDIDGEHYDGDLEHSARIGIIMAFSFFLTFGALGYGLFIFVVSL